MLLHGIQIKQRSCMQLLLELHTKITLNQFKTLRILLLFVAELTTTDLNIGDFFSAACQSTGIKRHHD
ncbi:hypothetical protein PFCIP103579_1121 [Prolinoborus fasciculus]|nr:hypothetical protein PFCIP103579_1121 [Prolinoborus fasciculus]